MEPKTFTRKQLEKIFKREALVFGETEGFVPFSAKEGLPMYRAREIFGDAAVDFACEMRKDGSLWNIYFVDGGNHKAKFLKWDGLTVAAAYCNVMSVSEKESSSYI